MKAIITGATGFIGVALCKELIQSGHEVTAVVREASTKLDLLPCETKIIEKNLDHLQDIEGHYDLFYHLAWSGASGASRNDFDTQNSNIKYTADAIHLAKSLGCKKFIGAGSQAEYGVVRGFCSESINPNPFMMYGAAKLSAYYMGKVLAEQLDISFVWPRIYSVYGVGENEGTLISYLIKSFKEGNAPELSSCENKWDYIYITDCVRALIRLGEIDETEGIYNISAGKSRVLKAFVEEIKDIINPSSAINYNAKELDINKTYFLEPDISKLENLGFKCNIEFGEGIRNIIRGYKTQ